MPGIDNPCIEAATSVIVFPPTLTAVLLITIFAGGLDNVGFATVLLIVA